MPRKKLTTAAIRHLAPGEFYDTIAPGLVLRVGKRRRKWDCRFHAHGSYQREPLGYFPAVGLNAARDAARKMIERVFRPRMIAYVRGEGERDYKTILQELASQELRAMPEYRLEERGPDHEKEFTATVHLGGEPMGTGIGRSKKEAEQQAAREAYTRISQRLAERGDGGD